MWFLLPFLVQVVHAEPIRETFTIEFTVPDVSSPATVDVPTLNFPAIDLATLMHQSVIMPLNQPETLHVTVPETASWTLAASFSPLVNQNGQTLTGSQLALNSASFAVLLTDQTPVDLWSSVGPKTTQLTGQTQLFLAENVWAQGGTYSAQIVWQLKTVPDPNAKNLTADQNYSILEVTKEN